MATIKIKQIKSKIGYPVDQKRLHGPSVKDQRIAGKAEV